MNELFSMYRAFVYRISLREYRKEDFADECAQRVMLKYQRYCDRIRNPWGWLKLAARTTAIDLRREEEKEERKKRKQTQEEKERIEGGSKADSPDCVFEYRELESRVIPDLVALEELMSSRLSLSPGEYRGRMHRLKQKIRRKIAE